MSRVVMSEAQFALFQRPASTVAKNATVRARRPKTELPENILEAQIKSFLEAHGWTCIRQQVGTYTPYRVLMAISEGKMTVEQGKRNIVRIGEKGAADWLAMRPLIAASLSGKPELLKAASPVQQVFYWEAKAPGKKPKPEQLAWLRAREATGTTARWFDTFNDGFSSDFVAWYRVTFESGAVQR